MSRWGHSQVGRADETSTETTIGQSPLVVQPKGQGLLRRRGCPPRAALMTVKVDARRCRAFMSYAKGGEVASETVKSRGHVAGRVRIQLPQA